MIISPPNIDIEINKTSPEDVSMSYMNIGNNTAELKL